MYEQKRFLKNAQLFEIQKVLHRLILPSRIENYGNLYLLPELAKEYATLTEGLLSYGEHPGVEFRLQELKLLYYHLGYVLALLKWVKHPVAAPEPREQQLLEAFMERMLQEICTLDYHLRLINEQKLD